MGSGGRKLGAYSILVTIFTGLFSWFFTIARMDIPQIKVNASSIQNNSSTIQNIQEDLRHLREGQTKILEILIHQK